MVLPWGSFGDSGRSSGDIFTKPPIIYLLHSRKKKLHQLEFHRSQNKPLGVNFGEAASASAQAITAEK
ncbi:Hypothetical predicted protein [Podarcis lilfordi]|uniref:Uncharacterized protein n=1 Tax=Podarcis lilfordi TaxID=74358 RepID=A0AA35JUT9_9SAUR|nr:Hypothetical predicted protein [Podarcis lilfordi]